MRILLYNPDNGVTRNFMPHLWMFLLQTITPPSHEVVLIDGNAQAMNDEEIVRFVREQKIGLVGIGAMTRLIAKAYRVADAMALGEADETWPVIVEDAARGQLKEVYTPVDEQGKERKPSLQPYPAIPWETLNIEQFNVVPGFMRPLLKRIRPDWETFRIIPIESGRG